MVNTTMMDGQSGPAGGCCRKYRGIHPFRALTLVFGVHSQQFVPQLNLAGLSFQKFYGVPGQISVIDADPLVTENLQIA